MAKSTGAHIDESRSGGGEDAALSLLPESFRRLFELSKSFESHSTAYTDALRSAVPGVLLESVSVAARTRLIEQVSIIVEAVDRSGVFGPERRSLEADAVGRINALLKPLKVAHRHGLGHEMLHTLSQATDPEERQLLLEGFKADYQLRSSAGVFGGLRAHADPRRAGQRAANYDRLSQWAQSQLREGEVGMDFLLPGRPSPGVVASLLASLTALLESQGVEDLEVSFREGSLFAFIKGKVKGLLHSQETKEVVRKAAKNAFDAATSKAAEAHKHDAEAELAGVEAELKRVEAALLSDPGVQQARELEAKAKALGALYDAKCKRLEELSRRNDLIQNTSGVIRDCLLKEQLAALSYLDDGRFGIVSRDGNLIWSEDGEEIETGPLMLDPVPETQEPDGDGGEPGAEDTGAAT